MSDKLAEWSVNATENCRANIIIEILLMNYRASLNDGKCISKYQEKKSNEIEMFLRARCTMHSIVNTNEIFC